MQQTFRGDLIPETTNLSQRRKGKMKQQFRFLLAGFSLIGLLVCHAIPAEAQTLNTTFTVTLVTLSLTVSPNSISIGQQAAAGTVTSVSGGSPSPITVTNTSAVRALVFIAGTNAKSTTDGNQDPSWTLEGTNGPDMFRFGFSTTGPAGSFTALDGPKAGSTQFGFPGPVEQVGPAFAQSEPRTVDWQMVMPTVNNKTGAQTFQVLFAASQAP